MKSLRWSNLTEAERNELQALIRSKVANPAWESSTDWLAFIILALPASIAGGIALGIAGIGISFEYLEFLAEQNGLLYTMRMTWFRWYFLIPFIFAFWLMVFTIRNWNRRGVAVTSFATVKVLGPKLKLVRHEDVARVELGHIRTAKSGFMVLELFDRHGAKSTFLPRSAFLAKAAIEAINRGRTEPVPINGQPAPVQESSQKTPEKPMASTNGLPSDRVLRELEQLAELVDRLESEGDEATAFAKRQRLLIEFEVSNLLPGTSALAEQFAAYPLLQAYQQASVALQQYQLSSARRRIMSTWPQFEVTQQHVSLDWFRKPSDCIPAGYTPHDWLALCERNFCESMPGGTGTLFVRLAGSICTLCYRREVDAQPKLFRADIEPARVSSAPKVYSNTAQATDGLAVARIAAQMADSIELTESSGSVEPILLPFSYQNRHLHLGYAQSPNSPDRYYLELTIRRSESSSAGQSQWLKQGSRHDLIAYLRRPEIVQEIEEAAEEGIISLARSNEPIDMHFGD